MTDESIIKAIAELDGYIPTGLERDSWYLTKMPMEIYSKMTEQDQAKFRTCILPSYLTSRDAIVPVVEKQSKATKENIVESLWLLLEIDSDFTEQEAWAKGFSTTPRQLCIALLKATGKYQN